MLIELSLLLRSTIGPNTVSIDGLRSAGEAIESVVRNGDSEAIDYGFNTIIGAAAYHLAHYSARAYSLLPGEISPRDNLSPCERALFYLIKRDLFAVRSTCAAFLNDQSVQDESIAAGLRSGKVSNEDATILVIQGNYFRALAGFVYALETGYDVAYKTAVSRLRDGVALCSEIGNVPLWWTNRLTLALTDDLWGQSLYQSIPPTIDGPDQDSWVALRGRYLRELTGRRVAELELWPSQIEAVARALDPAENLVIALPTGAGKTRIAELAILRALAGGKRCIYVSPLRALSAQLERSLRRTFSGLGRTVTSLYGAIGASIWDYADFDTADIVVATPEKLDYALRNNAEVLENVGLIVFDEGHMIGLNTRELRYEMLVQRLLRRPDARSRRLLCLSAMLPTGDDLSDFVDWISDGKQTEAVESSWRPTRQRFGIITREGANYRLDMRVESERPFVRAYVLSKEAIGRRKLPFPKDESELVVASAWRLREDGHSVLIYCPERRGVEAVGKRVLKLVEQGLISAQPAASERFQEAFRVGAEWLGVDHVVLECLKLGVGLHHGGLPRPFMQILETLISEKALKIIISSPTLAQGVNVTVSTIIFQSLYRGGELIELDEFLNVCGRAGRPFVDIDGQVIFTVNAMGAAGNPRRWAWDQLSSTANQRSLTSGLVALVRNLIKKLSLGKASPSEATEYILGMSLLHKNEADDKDDVEGDLRKLDEAILSLLGESSDCDPSDIAETLDDILQGSLWSRQLSRIDDAKRSIYQAVLTGRAEVIWRETSPAQRRAYHLAGLDLHAGLFLESEYPKLLPLLVAAEAAIAKGEQEEAVMAIAALAEVILHSEYFRADDGELPAHWKRILKQWLRGEASADIVAKNGNDAIDFIQGVISYKFVWALEALRSKAQSMGVDGLTGSAAVAADSGTCSLSSAMLLRSGLRSRVASEAITREKALTFSERSEMDAWLRTAEASNLGDAFSWPTPEAGAAWREFYVAMEQRDVFPLSTSKACEVQWSAAGLAPGTEVWLAEEAGVTNVHTIDLARVGELVPPIPGQLIGVTRGIVTKDGSKITRR